jgi:threo-3-hydroxy-L-aspartate ammonia-lyase
VEVPRTVLDGQQTTHIGRLPLAIARSLVDRVVGVSDEAALGTVGALAIRCKQVVEPSGASALAAILAGIVPADGRRIGVILSGGNVAPERLTESLRAVERPGWRQAGDDGRGPS